MRINIRQKDIEITSALQVYIETKLIKPLQRLLGKSLPQELPLLDIECARTTTHHRKGKVFYAEANLSIGKNRLRAEAQEDDMRKAIDILESELQREIKKFKERNRTRAKQDGRRVKETLKTIQ